MSEVKAMRQQQDDLRKHFDSKFEMLAMALSDKLSEQKSKANNKLTLTDHIQRLREEAAQKAKQDLIKTQALFKDEFEVSAPKVDLMTACVSNYKSKEQNASNLFSQVVQQRAKNA